MKKSDGSSLLPIAEQRLARAALARLAQPVASGKGRLVYLVGPAGCGKSALLYGLPAVTGSEFAAQFADASEKQTIPEFQERFRTVSVFVCEDIQPLNGRKETQQQLLAVIDELLAHGRDVVISSSKMPGQLEAFSAKLRNRFRGGTLVAVPLPGPDSRAILLRHFAQQRHVAFARDALALLAESLAVSPRELSGVVQQLAERHRSIKRADIEAFLQSDVPSITIRPVDVSRAVAAEFGVTQAALRSSNRSASLVLPRQCAMWLCRKLMDISFTKLGDFFERRHSSVMHAVQRLESRLQQEPKLRQRLAKIESTIRPTSNA